jgi:RNase P subunit RPR2
MDGFAAKEDTTNKTKMKMGICSKCKKPLNLSHPDAVNLKGQRYHSECARKARAFLDSHQTKHSNYLNPIDD